MRYSTSDERRSHYTRSNIPNAAQSSIQERADRSGYEEPDLADPQRPTDYRLFDELNLEAAVGYPRPGPSRHPPPGPAPAPSVN